MSFFALILLILTFTTNGETIYCDLEEGYSCACDSSIVGETCYLDCARDEACKDGRIQCRPGDACVIDCTGEDACAGNAKIIASGASTVTVICGDETSCKGNTEIYCGIGDCHIICTQDDSCEDTIIYINTASSFECSPVLYCQQAEYISMAAKLSDVSPSVEEAEISHSVEEIDVDTSTDIDIDIESTPESQEYGQMRARAGHEVDNISSNKVVFTDLLVVGLVFVLIIGTGIGCCHWRKKKYKQVLKEAMIEYGALS
eukprot:UN00133